MGLKLCGDPGVEGWSHRAGKEGPELRGTCLVHAFSQPGACWTNQVLALPALQLCGTMRLCLLCAVQPHTSEEPCDQPCAWQPQAKHQSLVLEEGACGYTQPWGSPALASLGTDSGHPDSAGKALCEPQTLSYGCCSGATGCNL